MDTTPEPNEWVRPVSLGVTATLIVWCFCGWIIDLGWGLEGLLLAVMTGVFQALGFNASAQMRRAAAKKRHRAKKFWAYVLCVTAGWTAFAAHHAYTVIGGEPPAFAWTVDGVLGLLQSSAALVLLAAAATIDPLLGWAIEDTERPAEAAPPAAQDSQPAAPRPARGSRPKLVEAGGKAALSAAVGLSALAALPAAAEPVRTPAYEPTANTRALGRDVDADRAKARAMLAAGERPGPVHRATQVPLSTCKRWAAELAA